MTHVSGMQLVIGHGKQIEREGGEERQGERIYGASKKVEN